MDEQKPTLVVAVAGGHKATQPWVEAFGARLPGWRVVSQGAESDPAGVRAVVAWRHAPGSLVAYRGLQAIFSLGAGVDHLLSDPGLPDVPIVRVVDPDLTSRMSEWCVLHVLRHHRQVARYERQQAEKLWDDDDTQPAAKDVRVGMMGLGVLGQDAARKLQTMGFDVAGWSRTPKSVPGLDTFAGDAGREAFLARTQILVVLLPLTPSTRGILDAALFHTLARDGHLGGPVVLNAGRGGLQNEADMLRCLGDGTLKAATLDVFDTEPLPATSPFWTHPGVTITPHNASVSNPAAVADRIAGQIRGMARGEPLDDVVDPARAY